MMTGNSSIKVLLLENIHSQAENVFIKAGCEAETLPKSLSEDELIDKIKDISVLGIRSKTQITKFVLDNAPRLITIGAFCVGTNQIDLNAALERGIAVFNAPYSNTRSVVELTIGAIIMLLRQTFDKSAKMHQGIWNKSAEKSFEVRGKKLGIIGYGNIGSQLSVLAEALGMEVYFYDIQDKLALGNARECDSMDNLLTKADIVTLHVDGNPKNKNLIGPRQLQMMKHGSYLINISRGFVVDLEALAFEILAGRLAGAAIDVYPQEPEQNREQFSCQLQNLPNVILTPHIGGATEEAQKNIAGYVPQKLINYINTGNSTASANFPSLNLSQINNAHRFIHIHDNVPGMMAQINDILGKRNINIEGQYLKTNEKIGYVITDVNKEYDNGVTDDLKNIRHTIKFRVLY